MFESPDVFILKSTEILHSSIWNIFQYVFSHRKKSYQIFFFLFKPFKPVCCTHAIRFRWHGMQNKMLQQRRMQWLQKKYSFAFKILFSQCLVKYVCQHKYWESTVTQYCCYFSLKPLCVEFWTFLTCHPAVVISKITLWTLFSTTLKLETLYRWKCSPIYDLKINVLPLASIYLSPRLLWVTFRPFRHGLLFSCEWWAPAVYPDFLYMMVCVFSELKKACNVTFAL